MYRSESKNIKDVVVKKQIKKKIVSPKNALLLSVIKTICDLVKKKKLEGIRSINVL